MRDIKVLVGCEESQEVCKAFRALGIEAYSNDLQPCSGGHPEWHLKMDVFEAIEKVKPDLLIAFPPCTFLTCRAQFWNKKLKRIKQKRNAINFFLKITNVPVDRIAIENPKGIMNSLYKKPTQIIQPFYFGDPHRKMTCLWLKGLPLLKWSARNDLFDSKTIVPEEIKYHKKDGKPIHWVDSFAPSKNRQKLRSKTFPGIAQAMATQWTEYLKQKAVV